MGVYTGHDLTKCRRSGLFKGKQETSTGAAITITLDRVPQNEIWLIKVASFYNNTSVVGAVPTDIRVVDGPHICKLAYWSGLSTPRPLVVSSEFYVFPGQELQAYHEGSLAGDNLRLTAIGEIIHLDIT